MDIEKITLDKKDQDNLFLILTQQFDLYSSDLFSSLGKTIETEFLDLFEINATLKLSEDSTEPDENNQYVTLKKSVCKFCYKVLYQGKLVETNDFNMDERISNYFTV
jgi:hypothetical protein